MKRLLLILLCVLLTLGAFSGCAAGNTTADGKIKIVATTFPLYDWVRQIAGQDAQIVMLLDKGVDLHSYQPTADDIAQIKTCDMFLYVGGESDRWTGDALQDAVKPDRIALSMMETLGDAARREEVVEGMESEEEEEGEPEYDEHVWLSVKNAARLCRAIADALKKILPDRKDSIEKNAAAYIEKLSALDADYQAAADGAKVRTLLFGDRFPFRYLTEDYGLSYYAAFSGCSAETEASFKTVVFLAGKADELGLRTILTIDSSDGAIARTIRNTTKTKDQDILTLDSMQSMTAAGVAAGKTNLSVMEQNLDVLKKAMR